MLNYLFRMSFSIQITGYMCNLYFLLQVTYCPDCTRACKYDMDIVVGEGGVAKGSDFFNNVFKCLFLNEISQVSPL
jgi:hypothetical protein